MFFKNIMFFSLPLLFATTSAEFVLASGEEDEDFEKLIQPRHWVDKKRAAFISGSFTKQKSPQVSPSSTSPLDSNNNATALNPARSGEGETGSKVRSWAHHKNSWNSLTKPSQESSLEEKEKKTNTDVIHSPRELNEQELQTYYSANHNQCEPNGVLRVLHEEDLATLFYAPLHFASNSSMQAPEYCDIRGMPAALKVPPDTLEALQGFLKKVIAPEPTLNPSAPQEEYRDLEKDFESLRKDLEEIDRELNIEPPKKKSVECFKKNSKLAAIYRTDEHRPIATNMAAGERNFLATYVLVTINKEDGNGLEVVYGEDYTDKEGQIRKHPQTFKVNFQL